MALATAAVTPPVAGFDAELTASLRLRLSDGLSSKVEIGPCVCVEARYGVLEAGDGECWDGVSRLWLTPFVFAGV